MEWMGSFLKIWADRYGFRAEIKTDSAVMRPEKIFVTSNYHPSDIFKDASVLQAILDRFNVVEITALQQFDERPAKKPKLKRTQDKIYDAMEPKFSVNANGQLVAYKNKNQTLDQVVALNQTQEIGYDPREKEPVSEEDDMVIIHSPDAERYDYHEEGCECNVCINF